MRKWVVRSAAIAGLTAVMGATWIGIGLYRSWNDVERVEFDPSAARQRLAPEPAVTTTSAVAEARTSPTTNPPNTEAPGSSTTTTTTTVPAQPDSTVPATTIAPAADGDVLSILIVGSDSRPEKPAENADVIALFQLGEAESLLVSLPRDLQVVDPCTGVPSKLATIGSGCEESASGPEVLAVAIEDLTGLAINHYVAFDLAGFRNIIDQLGGVSICVEHPVRFHRTRGIDLPSGCTVVDGRTAEFWIRVRAAQELVDNVWRPIEPGGDAARNQRQQDVILDLMGRITSINSIGELQALVEELANSFVLDDTLTLPAAINLAWQARTLDPASIRRPLVPVSPTVSDDGTFYLTLDSPFAEVIATP